MKYALEMKNISKSFSGIKVLNDISLNVKAGEVHALMGENGAGKSTLMKILLGIYKADTGNIRFNGEEIHVHNPREARDMGISMIHQELNVLLDMEVAENVFTGRELLKKGFEKFKIVDRERMREETQKYFDEMEIDIDPKAHMRELSIAQMQLVEIVKAISLRARILVMDEPTSAITEREAVILFRQIDRLKAQGVGIVYISHKMDEIFKISDTITILRDGEWIVTKPSHELDEDSLIKYMVGREISEIYPKEPTTIGDVVFEVKGLSRNKKFDDVSFALHKSEVLGIAGLVGAGRSEVVETIFGMYQKSAGSVYLDGSEVIIKHPLDAIRHRIALITEDRKHTGLNLRASVKENISLVGIGDILSSHGILDAQKEKKAADTYISELKIKTPSRDAMVENLSGGNQQKVVLAKWLLKDPEVIIFDEPTRGIDVGAKRDIYLLINKLAKQGKSVIVISSEMPELMGITDRIIVMCEGKVTGEVGRDQFSQEIIMGYASRAEGSVV
ncbi:MAG: sugar ABC transporter ATP-binding protein [Lachnospiraceae bacterium]